MNRLDRFKYAVWRLSNKYLSSSSPVKKTMPGDRLTRIPKQYNFKAELSIKSWESAVFLAEDPINNYRLEYYLLCREALRDCKLGASIDNRIERTTGTPFVLVDEFGNESEEHTKLLMKPWMYDTMKYALESIFWGHSLIDYGNLVKSTNKLIEYEMASPELIPRWHVRPIEGQILAYATDRTGMPYRDNPGNWLEFGRPTNLGLLMPLIKEVIYKNYSRADWSRYGERFGMPLIHIATEGMSEDEIDKAEAFAANFGNSGYIITPRLDQVSIVEPKNASDSSKMYLEQIKYSDESMFVRVTGGTATQAEKAHVGSAEVQERTLGEIVEDDRRWLSMEINHKLFPLLIKNGYPLQDLEFKFLEENPNDTMVSDTNGGNNGKKP